MGAHLEVEDLNLPVHPESNPTFDHKLWIVTISITLQIQSAEI